MGDELSGMETKSELCRFKLGTDTPILIEWNIHDTGGQPEITKSSRLGDGFEKLELLT